MNPLEVPAHFRQNTKSCAQVMAGGARFVKTERCDYTDERTQIINKY